MRIFWSKRPKYIEEERDKKRQDYSKTQKIYKKDGRRLKKKDYGLSESQR